MANHRLDAAHITKSYGGRRVVNQVSISVRNGEVVGLLGPNGAGKTTTFYTCVGLVAPDSGVVSLNGTEITDLPMYARARKGIGYLPQEPSIFRKLTVDENILAILETVDDISQKERSDRLEELIKDFGLSHVRETTASALSGGERRRVEIARALARAPRFMLLDEPFAGIDPIAVQEIQSIIATLRDHGLGVLITDHNVRETLGICDRAYIMVDGKVLEEGSPNRIAESELARRYYLGENFAL